MRSIVLLALLASCDKRAAPPVDRDDEAPLLSPGAEPRRALRYHLTAGQTTPLEMTMELDLASDGKEFAMPALVLGFELAVLEVKTTGDATIRTTIARAEARARGELPIPIAQFNDGLRSFQGVTITSSLDPRGRQRDARMDTKQLAPELVPQLQAMTQGLEQLAMPMPTQPIGVGARWSVTKPLAQQGLEVTGTTTVEITAIDGDRVSFKTTTQVQGPDQTATLGPNTVRMTKIGGGGGGQGTVDLGKPGMQGEFRLEFHGDATRDGKTTPMKFAMALAVAPAQGTHKAP